MTGVLAMQQPEADITSLFRAGALDAAVTAANLAVRKAPASAVLRIMLAELLVFTGNLERADRVLDAATDPGAAVAIAEFRQLLRAEMGRQQFWRDGRTPHVLSRPRDMERSLLSAMVSLRGQEAETAARQADQAEAERPRTPVRIGGTTYPDFRDADDLCAGMMELLTPTGKFYWVPFSCIQAIRFHAPRRARDLVWRRAHVEVADGPDGDVYLPVLYDNDRAPASDALRLGRATDWIGTAPVRGSGQRVFLAGDEGFGIMDLTELQFLS